MKKYFSLIIVLVLIAGCASYRPVVDMRGIPLDVYNSDVTACQQIAKQVSPGTNAVISSGTLFF